MLISIDRITVGKRLRTNISQQKIEDIAESIRQIGLINPIYVDKTEKEGEYKLIAGLHRLEATKLNGSLEIEANVTEETNPLIIELAEIDENLMRNDKMHYLERGEHMARRKAIYEQLYPQTLPRNKPGHGGNYTGEMISFEPKPFTEDVAKKLNVSQRTVQNEIQIAQNLIPEAKQLVKEKDVGKVDAIQLARLDPEEQKKVAQKMTESGLDKVKAVIQEMRKEGDNKVDESVDRNLEANLQEAEKGLIQVGRNFKKYIEEWNKERIPKEQREYVLCFLQEIQKELQKCFRAKEVKIYEG